MKNYGRTFLILICLAAFAAPPPKGEPAQIRIPVWAEGGKLIAATDLQATIGGADARILDIKAPGDDQIVLVVLDLSGDVALADPAKEALISRIRSLPDSTWVGLLRAQDGLSVLLDPTPDRDAAVQAIRTLPVTGRAGLLDTAEAIGKIADSMAAKSAVRLAILYITDSTVENYREDFTNPVINSSDSHDLSRKFPEALIQQRIAKLEGNLSLQQTPLFIVHLRYRTDRLNEAYQSGLKRLAETTVGKSVFCRSSAEIPDAIGKAFESISSEYSVALAVPAQIRSPRIEIRVTANSEEGQYALVYRTRLALRGSNK